MVEVQCLANTGEANSEATRIRPRYQLSVIDALGNVNAEAVWAKQLEIKVAAANLGHAEYYFERLKARVDYLEARVSTDAGISRRELEELMWARSALPANAATLKALSDELRRGRRELDILLNQPGAPAAMAVSISKPAADLI